jgi:hypothetical protein
MRRPALKKGAYMEGGVTSAVDNPVARPVGPRRGFWISVQSSKGALPPPLSFPAPSAEHFSTDLAFHEVDERQTAKVRSNCAMVPEKAKNAGRQR